MLWPGLMPLFMIVALLGLLLRLNARDRRRDVLIARMWDLMPRDLRCSVAVHVRCGLLSGRSRVDVDIGSCTCAEICTQAADWRAGLPKGVRLVVRGGTGPGPTPDFTIDVVAA